MKENNSVENRPDFNKLSELKSAFSNVNDWLKFAEAKNAALIALNGVLIANYIKIYSILFEKINTPNWVQYIFYYYYICLVVFSLISLFLCLMSFFPKTGTLYRFNKNKTLVQKEVTDTCNILFYTHINIYNKKSEQYISDFKEERLIKDYSNQIFENAEIATRKYTLFKFALQANVFSLFNIIGFLIFNITEMFMKDR